MRDKKMRFSVITAVLLASCLAALAALAGTATVNLTVTVLQGQPSGGPCPQGTAYLSVGDGCQGAQISGSLSPIATFFTGYTGQSYPIRPPWNVAGVDYPVGYSGALNDPRISANLPSCASYASNVLTVTAPCTISH